MGVGWVRRIMVETVMLLGGGVSLREMEEMEFWDLMKLWILVRKLGMFWHFGVVPEEEKEKEEEIRAGSLRGFGGALARSVRRKEIYERLMKRIAERN